MKTIPATLQSHLNEQVNTTCLLLRIERNAGAFGTALPVLGVTTLDQDVTYNDGNGAVTYSAASGFVPSNLSASGDMGVDNAEAEILVPAFDLGPVVEADINAGRYDSAPFILYRVNYKDLTTGRHEIIMSGTLGQARVIGGLSAFCELRSISQQFKQTVCEVDSITCRADFGSTACGVDISTLWETGEVSAVGTETDREFSADTALAEGDLVPGIVQWLTGDNAGRSYEIEAHAVTIGGGGGGGGGGSGDPDFGKVVSLLHFDGTDGSTTFTDVITRTWTAAGNAQLDTAQSKFGGASGLMDGTGDYISSTTDTAFQLSGSDFTIEGWVRFNSVASSQGLWDRRSALLARGLGIFLDSATAKINAVGGDSNTSGWEVQLVSTGTQTTGVWYHVAFVRSGTTYYLFIDGVLQASTTNAVTIVDDTSNTVMGALVAGNFPLNGWLDDWRVTKLARYTAGFTPPAAAFPDVGSGDSNFASVSALLHFDGADGSTTFTDVTGKTFTATGNAQIDTAQSKFGGSAGLWDGSGDIVSSTDTGIIDLATDFTIEYWVRQATAGSSVMIHNHFYNSGGTNNGLSIYRRVSDGAFMVDNGLTATTAGTIAVPLNTWTHIAVVRDSGTIRGYVNGVQALSHAAQSYPATINLSSIGMFKGGLYAFDGHIDDWRVTNGVCRYPGGTTFTVPNAAFQDFATGDADFASVASLLHFNGADASTTFTDVTGKVWTASGNAQIDTAQSKFGGAAGLFDGSTDFITSPTSADFTFGTGDFTVEFFLRANNYTSSPVLYDGRPVTEGNQVVLYIPSGTGKVNFYMNGSSRIVGTTSITSGVWRHIALCRASGNTKLFIDGIQEGSTFADSTNYTDTRAIIGADRAGITNGLDGWIDELRVTKGVARYTAAFTPPTAPFPDAAPSGGGGAGDLATVQLTFPTPFPIVAGDTFKWRPDCGKQFIRDCKDIWNNVLNFRGEPYIPVADEASMATPGANKPGPNSGTPVDNPWTPPA